VARRGEVGRGQIYRWRQKLRAAADEFAQVRIAPAGNMASNAEAGTACCSEPAIEIECAGQARARIPGSISTASRVL